MKIFVTALAICTLGSIAAMELQMVEKSLEKPVERDAKRHCLELSGMLSNSPHPLLLKRLKAPEIGNDTRRCMLVMDEQEFEIELKAAELSATIKNLISDLGTDHPVPLGCVDPKAGRCVLECLKVLAMIKDSHSYGQQVYAALMYLLGVDLDGSLKIVEVDLLGYLRTCTLAEFICLLHGDEVKENPYLNDVYTKALEKYRQATGKN